MRPSAKNVWRPCFAALLYLLLGGAWIGFSDRILLEFVKDPQLLTQLQTGKGWLFVLLTAVMAFVLVRQAHSDNVRSQLAEAKVARLSTHDPLTDLPNRALAMDRLKVALARAQTSNTRLAVLYMDIDHFKSVNDSLGHAMGDALLQAVAQRLVETVSGSDSVCRPGSDEFLLLLTDVGSIDAVARATEDLLRSLTQPFQLGGQHLSISVSVGVALYPADGTDGEALLRKADLSMYQAKEAGRNTYRFYAESMNAKAVAHLGLRSELATALARQEFVLHYQPQVSLRDGRAFGVEALLRWNSPTRGLVGPDLFVGIAEDSGQIEAIGTWVLREACRQAAAWQHNGVGPVGMAVNVSAVQFRRGNFVEIVASALQDSGLQPALLELELTESVLIRDTENVLDAVNQLKLMGVRLSIDDFGTGYSSLAYIKRFPLDKVKIDKSFVRDLAIDKGDAALVEAIIRMAQTLGLTTLAEGVEQQAALECLQHLGCDQAQGYFFARPMPADDVASFMRMHHPPILPS